MLGSPVVGLTVKLGITLCIGESGEKLDVSKEGLQVFSPLTLMRNQSSYPLFSVSLLKTFNQIVGQRLFLKLLHKRLRKII